MTSVLIRDVIESQEFYRAQIRCGLCPGRDVGGSNIIGNIENCPMYSLPVPPASTPEEVRFIMVDPKMVELAPLQWDSPPADPGGDGPEESGWCFAVGCVRDDEAVQDLLGKRREEAGGIQQAGGQREDLEKLPSVVVVIDELADLMLVAAKEVEESICRVAQMGRAAGVHLVIATQRPSADVITGLMKANIPSRIAFAVASSLESCIILDTTGAEKLVGKGDMLYAPLAAASPGPGLLYLR